jgi:hypothetical protein
MRMVGREADKADEPEPKTSEALRPSSLPWRSPQEPPNYGFPEPEIMEGYQKKESLLVSPFNYADSRSAVIGKHRMSWCEDVNIGRLFS